ncbi:CBO0543 family protein [Paenibacillus xerothermodurans]|uniref:Uncharacterized protein n=1 Tax=Paenibacillus xerothermodurans TaxID=1977292 RepID=A0A2W1N7D8_PAEXE|nr:CBO0543 family protein [Paenibacillus xerothermodurans]PZE19500.1 hypothetical protein CBW46_018355 [Paenibacillus xerothermodurans]
MSDELENFARQRRLINELVQTNMDSFLNYGFLSLQWWLLLAFLILPWVLWLKIARKHRLLETVLVGTIVIILTTLHDWVGYNFNFWDYPVEIVPLLPGALPFDLSVVPVAYMLLYQFCLTWKSYLIGLGCMTFIYAFIGEPFANWMELVVYFKWSSIYSVIYYIFTGVVVRASVDKLAAVSIPAQRVKG